jgi:hypothetical protein
MTDQNKTAPINCHAFILDLKTPLFSLNDHIDRNVWYYLQTETYAVYLAHPWHARIFAVCVIWI